MKQVSTELQAHLDSGATTTCFCWRVTRRDTQAFGFTNHDRVLNFDGTDFEPDTGFTPSQINQGLDMAVDAQDIEGLLRSDRISEIDILDGLWDGSAVESWLVNWSNVSERVMMRRGAFGEIRRGSQAFTAEVRSLAYALSDPTGRTLQAGCDAVLGDARCRVDLDDPSLNGTGSVASVTRDRAFVTNELGAFADGLFTNGLLTWSTGQNTGRVAEVLLHSMVDGIVSIVLTEAPLKGISASDAFSIVAGCDNSRGQCQSRFANIVNFRGFPDIPPASSVLRYAAEDDANAGAVL